MTKFKIILFCLLFGLLGCEPAATFEESQPANSKNLNGFPKKLIGTYQSLEDGSLLRISKDKLVATYDYDYNIHKNQLDSGQILKGDLLINLETKERKKVQLKGDSIVLHHFSQDTLFDLSQGNILKKFKGYYFLNTPYNQKKWVVQSLVYQKGKLSLKKISDKDDLKKLRVITETTNDTVTLFKPSKKQFRRYIKQNGFADEEQFIKIK